MFRFYGVKPEFASQQWQLKDAESINPGAIATRGD